MNYSNLHLMWKEKMVSLLYKLLQECFKSCPNFMSVLKIVHSSPGSHNKVICMIFFCYAYKSNQVQKLQKKLEKKSSVS